ncbi:MAG: hypothetical protein ACYS1A_13060 [Planctomycetota bacterium]|jgi:hypothetical protein
MCKKLVFLFSLISVLALVSSVSAQFTATNPNPANLANDVSTDVDLSWDAGSDAISHDVYLNTSFDSVNNAVRSAGDVDGNGQVDWADVWVVAEKWLQYPEDVFPCADLDGDNNVNVADFAIIAYSWTENAVAAFKGSQTATTFDPGTMDNDTTYYWRIDEVNGVDVWFGDVWSFTTQSAGQGALLQDSGTDGIVSMEAENYDNNTSQGAHDWTFITSPSGYTGSGAMEATPNSGTNQNTGYATNSPRLDFLVDFVNTGTHYIWVRGYGASGSDDSCHAGLDGLEIATCDRISTFTTSYGWSKATMDGTDATFDVPSTGVHTVNIWMREDGFIADKIVLTTNSGYTPTGDGPAESQRGLPQPPEQAGGPSPGNSAADVSIYTDLNWTAGSGTISHDVYFGTDSTPDSGEFKGNQGTTTYAPGTLLYDTTYYWRIDEVNGQGTTTGIVWSFTTEAVPPPPGQASNPGPGDGATDVSIYANLSWTAGSGSTSSDVYFGTDLTPDSGELQGNQTATTFEPGTLANNTTYYWRIDQVNGGGTTTGNIWSFTTEQQTQPPTHECDNWQILHPEWIFCDDFEVDSAFVRQGRYFEYSNNGGDFVPLNGIGLDASKGMRVIFQQGEVSAGGFKLGFGRVPQGYFDKGIRNTEDFREVYYRMYLKMQPGWVGSPGKLSRATCFSSSGDWSQAMIAHLWSSGDYLLVDPVRCVDPVTSLVKCVGYNDFGNMDWIGNQAGVTPIFDSLHDGIWYCVEARVKLNDPGTGNGIQDFWIDGNLEARRAGLNFVASYTDYAINAVLFENYWNSGSPQLQERYFDNIVVSTQPIGPSQ